MEGFAVRRDRDRHVKTKHGKPDQADKYYCAYELCQRHVKPFGRADNLRRHVREIHSSFNGFGTAKATKL